MRAGADRAGIVLRRDREREDAAVHRVEPYAGADAAADGRRRGVADVDMDADAVLPGAELEKILAMMLVTGIIGLSLYRGRALLVRATTETMAAKRLSRFFDSSVAEDIRSGESPIALGEGRAREAAILNVDIRGFSRLIENLPPSEAIAMLTAYQRRVVPIVQANGGVIDKFMGDGIMATFGAVRPDRLAACSTQ